MRVEPIGTRVSSKFWEVCILNRAFACWCRCCCWWWWWWWWWCSCSCSCFFLGGNKLLFGNGFEKIPKMGNSDKKSAIFCWSFLVHPLERWSCDIWFTLSVIHVDETTVSKLVWILLISSYSCLVCVVIRPQAATIKKLLGHPSCYCIALMYTWYAYVCLHCLILFQRKHMEKGKSLHVLCKKCGQVERIQHHRAMGFELDLMCAPVVLISQVHPGAQVPLTTQFFCKILEAKGLDFLWFGFLLSQEVSDSKSIGSRTQICL